MTSKPATPRERAVIAAAKKWKAASDKLAASDREECVKNMRAFDIYDAALYKSIAALEREEQTLRNKYTGRFKRREVKK